ncbi:MAG: Crp/Fnr family transcriptional regulator [Nevskia sp.]|nr:Crp/Fnr family transcriptional regulator [Nevskia sp.]
MAMATRGPVVNRLIAGLPRAERNRILEDCERVDLVFGSTLCEPGKSFQYVYFPLTAFVSLVETVGNHRPLEVGLVGNEGMLGVTLALGVDAARLRGVVQGPGVALRMSASDLKSSLRTSPHLLRTLNRYMYVLMAQMSQIAACSCFHAVEARLARWLLMMHDRAHTDHFHLTHELLADTLGVRRSAVTISAGVLQKKKLIRYRRGEISILDREGLEAATCECYGIVVDDYTRLLS